MNLTDPAVLSKPRELSPSNLEANAAPQTKLSDG
jgi:hypothetical protein